MPGVAQGAGTACWCMRRTILSCHVALSKDTWLLVRVRKCGPCLTIFERRSQSRWHESTLSAARGTETGCAPGKNNTKSSDTSLDLMPTLHSYGPWFNILEGRILPATGACTTWPSCLRVLCACLRVPCLCFCVCQSACVGRHRVPARACGACEFPRARIPCLYLRVPSLCLRVCFVCPWLTYLLQWVFPPHRYAAIVFYDSLQLNSSMQKTKDKGHRAHR